MADDAVEHALDLVHLERDDDLDLVELLLLEGLALLNLFVRLLASSDTDQTLNGSVPSRFEAL